MSNHTPSCRACGEPGLTSILDLGRTPLANRLLTEQQLTEPEPAYPLELALCPQCSLVQITEIVPPEQLFGEYLYFSSFSDTMVQHARQLTEKLISKRALNSDSFIIEIASNDGYLLQHFVQAGIPVLGIEPATNIAKAAQERGIPTIARFFGAELAEELAAEGKQADVIIANNVMAHVPEINNVMAGIKTLLKPGGAFVMETPYVKDMVDHLEFDTIYHEHVFYYSLTALEGLFRRHGLAAAAVERIPIHGGSLRVTAMHAGEEGERSDVSTLLAEEAGWGVANYDFYHQFSDRVAQLKAQLRDLLHDIKVQGKSIAAYGASAKGSTLLNYFGIGNETLDFMVDRSTVKQGHYTPGTHLSIYDPARLLQDQPDYVLLLTWNFAEEILAQQSPYRERGGRFIIPLPQPKIV